MVDPQQFPDLATLGLEALKGRIASPTVEEAVGTSTDKASLAILAFEVAHPTQAVTFSICGDDCTTGPVSDGSRGSLLPMSAFSVSPAPTELDGAPTVSTTPELIGGRSFAFALYKPPDLLPATWAGGSIPGMFSVSAFQSGAPATRSLALVTPPVLLVHGIWSDGDAWAEFAEYLRARLPGRVIPVEYGIHNASSFADPRVQRAFDTQLRAELKHARMAGIVANRVDVVGHSMGGLVARRFADPSSVRYVGPPNYGLGYIRKLITVGSPHLGSSLAPWVHSHAGRLPDSGMTVWYPVTLGEALLAAGMDVDSGGLEALIPGSDDLGGLPDQLPYMTISGVAPSSRLSTRGALELIVRAYDGLSAPLGDSLDSIFGSSNHDTIVEVQSQAYGAGSAVQIADLLHASVGETLGLDEATETNSPAVFRQVTCWLTAGRLCETAVSLVPTSAHAQVTMGSPVPAIWDIDFGALTQRPSAELTVTPNAGVLPQGRPTTISVGSTGRPIARVAILVGTYLGDRTAAPYSWPVTPNHAGSLAVTVVALFQDNSYARTTLTYQVQPVAALVSLRAEPSTIVLPSLDDSARIVLHGSYANGVTIRIEEGAAFALGSGAGVAQVSSSGEVTALAPGEASASVSYSGKSILVPIRVFGSGDIIFRNGFEGIGPAVALTRSLVQP